MTVTAELNRLVGRFWHYVKQKSDYVVIGNSCRYIFLMTPSLKNVKKNKNFQNCIRNITPEEILALNLTLTFIKRLNFSCSRAIFEFCAKIRLIKNERICIMCGSNIHLIKKKTVH
jgi:hypothetical protein